MAAKAHCSSMSSVGEDISCGLLPIQADFFFAFLSFFAWDGSCAPNEAYGPHNDAPFSHGFKTSHPWLTDHGCSMPLTLGFAGLGGGVGGSVPGGVYLLLT